MTPASTQPRAPPLRPGAPSWRRPPLQQRLRPAQLPKGDPGAARLRSLTRTRSAAQSRAAPARTGPRTGSRSAQAGEPRRERQAYSREAPQSGERGRGGGKGRATTASADARPRGNLRLRVRRARPREGGPGARTAHACSAPPTPALTPGSAAAGRCALPVISVSPDLKGKKRGHPRPAKLKHSSVARGDVRRRHLDAQTTSLEEGDSLRWAERVGLSAPRTSPGLVRCMAG